MMPFGKAPGGQVETLLTKPSVVKSDNRKGNFEPRPYQCFSLEEVAPRSRHTRRALTDYGIAAALVVMIAIGCWGVLIAWAVL